MGSARYFITTPIFYVNAAPHIGHYHTVVLADTLHRVHKLLAPKQHTVFATGTDEHGLKIQQAATRAHQHEVTFCSEISTKFKDLFDSSSITHTHFTRTSDTRHKKCVRHFWDKLRQDGHLYSGSYKGWYCTQDEVFLSESEIKEVTGHQGVPQKVSIESGHPVEWMEEKNYMFKLSEFQDDLLHWLRSSESIVQPSKFQSLLKNWISAGLNDLSVSRQSSRVHWGIPVPGDDTQTIYVWLDALVNYLTASGYPDSNHMWPPDCHVIGKDILKFHGIYWPAFLMAAGLEPPRHILCHSHWMVNDEKMSKSKGNVVCPFNEIERYTADGLRYFLLREGVPHSDGNFSSTSVHRLLNAELADNLGNLLSRCTALLVNKDQIFPSCDKAFFKSFPRGQKLLQEVYELPDKVRAKYLEGNIYLGLDAIMHVLRQTNALVQDNKPWELAKSEGCQDLLHAVLYASLEALRVSAIIMQPVIPTIASKVLDKLNIGENERNWTDAERSNIHQRSLAVENIYVFPRLKAQRAL
ncbi:methionine--tRNA ligase, mitochondrial-like [Ornithodoros turicata]|uniref:methionine--tRNA ligase, mitochondrial-like n=1 Tax=Ornithodoros turicata TaxID=34597 RepID=UPI003138D50C